MLEGTSVTSSGLNLTIPFTPKVSTTPT